MVIFEYLDGKIILSIKDEDGFWIEKGRFALRGEPLRLFINTYKVYDGLTGARLIDKKD